MVKTFTRMAVAGAAVVSVLAVTASQAQAAVLVSNKTISNSHGKMTFIDDGDVFQVCDTKADGHGMTGELVQIYDAGANQVRLTVTDGGDSGCDKKGYNIGNQFNEQYEMWLSWNGGGATVKSERFNE
ncbi:hypothetical protein ACIHCQ_38925 [Streptomyces sp. NPDC052236]|uniref:hypothetical protein n=1 Tax=Streptomyces sp. NPDC052236 TaxID=3365686 RepID=UPI0037D4A510